MIFYTHLVMRSLLETRLINIVICLSWSARTMTNIVNYCMLKINGMKEIIFMILAKSCLTLNTKYKAP